MLLSWLENMHGMGVTGFDEFVRWNAADTDEGDGEDWDEDESGGWYRDEGQGAACHAEEA